MLDRPHTLRLERADLLIANLLIEYVGADEFVAFVDANAPAIGVLSCVTQQNRGVGIVSSTDHSSAFTALETIASEIDPDSLASAMSAIRFPLTNRVEYPLPNGKALIRQDFERGP